MIPPTFQESAAAIGVRLDKGDPERLDRYLDLLFDANTRFNLTAVRDRDEAWRRHILDSLTVLPVIASAKAKGVVDVGSGGGLPGIPLAICLPGVRFTLMESTGKKAAFLEMVRRELRLENVTVVNERAETAGRDERRFRGRFDAAMSRAVGSLAVVLELSVPLVRKGGFVIAIKGGKAEEELKEAEGAMRRLRARHVETMVTPTGRLVLVEKVGETPKDYPRSAGEPKRAPL